MSLLFSSEDENLETISRICELEAEVQRLRAELTRVTDLMMAGERLREQLMIKAIIAGAFNQEP